VLNHRDKAHRVGRLAGGASSSEVDVVDARGASVCTVAPDRALKVALPRIELMSRAESCPNAAVEQTPHSR
jgi:hypothetical protein